MQEALAAEELLFHFPSGHDFSRAANGAKQLWLQPLRVALAVFFRRPGLQSRRKAPGSDGLQPLKKCFSLSLRNHSATPNEGLP